MKKTIVVIGAGFGGLTAAALLSQAGHKVILLEQGDWIGGKSRRLSISGQVIDSGPSLVTFAEVWHTVLNTYRSLGGAISEEPEFLRLPEVGRYFYQSDAIDIPIPQSHPWFPAWQRFVSENAGLADSISKLLTSHPFDPGTLESVTSLLSAYKGKLSTEKYLQSLSYLPSGLRDLIAIHTLNAGVAPDQTLPIYASVTAIMSEQGILVPAGGVNELPLFLSKLALASGCDIRLNTQVMKIEKGLVTTSTEKIECDVVVSGIDAYKTDELITGKKARTPRSRSCSGVAIYGVLKKPLPEGTVTHSVVMPDNPAELYQRLKSNQQPDQTMAFVNYYKPNEIYKNTKHTVAVLLTAAADGQEADLQTRWVQRELERISQVMQLPERIDALFEDYEILHPQYFETVGGPMGAIYGKKNPLWRSGPFHSPTYRSPFRPWLYRVGSSVHPGGGMPAVMGGAMNAIRGLL